MAAADWPPQERIHRLLELGVDTVICGGIDRWTTVALQSDIDERKILNWRLVMPRGDGTGPQGEGPGTGRGMGPCGAGKGRGQGRGRGQELDLLKRQAKGFASALDDLKRRIAELEPQPQED